MDEHRKLTQAELLAEASERFGTDPMGWAFRCPNCEDIATGQDFRNALEDRPRKHSNGDKVLASDLIGQECIRRTLPKGGRGCDWVAYGLIRGPWEVALPTGRTVWCFPLADASADGPAMSADVPADALVTPVGGA